MLLLNKPRAIFHCSICFRAVLEAQRGSRRLQHCGIRWNQKSVFRFLSPTTNWSRFVVTSVHLYLFFLAVLVCVGITGLIQLCLSINWSFICNKSNTHSKTSFHEIICQFVIFHSFANVISGVENFCKFPLFICSQIASSWFLTVCTLYRVAGSLSLLPFSVPSPLAFPFLQLVK